VIQIGTGEEISIGDLVDRVASILDRRLRVQSEGRRRRPRKSEVERLVASNEEARRRLGWKPAVSLELGLRRTIEWFRERPGSYKQELYHI
jgi:nucleoside-diphosphate-sugar epimerase